MSFRPAKTLHHAAAHRDGQIRAPLGDEGVDRVGRTFSAATYAADDAFLAHIAPTARAGLTRALRSLARPAG
jgi:hypothetical protein